MSHKNIATAVIASLFVLGCSSKQEISMANTQPPTPTAKEIQNKLKEAPKWVFDQTDDKGIIGVGSAQATKAGLGFQRNEALALARDDLARQLQVKVNNMVKHFAETTGIAKGETVDKVATQVSKQVASQTIVGSRQKDMWLSADGELFVLAVIDATSLSANIKDAMTTSFKNERAMWQKFEAKKAQEELTKEVEKLTSEVNVNTPAEQVKKDN